MHKKTLVTSALPYVNNVPHLGNLVCVISADVYTRYLRFKGEDVMSVLGTDEHGTTTETKALQEGLSPKQVCDKYYKIHKEIYEWFGNSFDCMGRTSSEDNKLITLDIFKKLQKNGYIIEQDVEQNYCESCEKFLADRFVEGTCPFCEYSEARGDQCESCGKLLNATELKNPRCKVCGKRPVIKSTNHLFIDLPKLEPDIRKWMEKRKKNWSANARTMTEAWLRDGIKPRAITRDLKWGIPVPGMKKVFYSWFDAPIGYIGITKECKKDWKSWWHNDSEVRLVQFMGKDNIPFHTILFPSFLIGTKDNYTLLDSISVNEYMNYEGGMFSKSRGVGVFGDDARSTGIPSDVWRYYIMINRPEKADTEFSWDDFQLKLNNELVANIGNLVNRTLTFLERFYESNVPGKVDLKFYAKVVDHVKHITYLLDAIELKEALKEIMKLSKLGNQYFQDNAPWKLVNEDQKRAADVLTTLVHLVKDLSILIGPYMPATSASIQEQLGVECVWKDIANSILPKGSVVKKKGILFNKLEDVEKDALSEKFRDQTEKVFPLDLKVAKVLKVEDHPDADKLYVISIDLGEKRTIVAGIKPYYPAEKLIGKYLVVVSNLEPSKFRGIKSEAMLLAADSGSDVVVLQASKSKPGDPVFVDGFKTGKKQVSYKEFSRLELSVVKGKACFSGHVLKTEKEEIVTTAKDGSKIR